MFPPSIIVSQWLGVFVYPKNALLRSPQPYIDLPYCYIAPVHKMAPLAGAYNYTYIYPSHEKDQFTRFINSFDGHLAPVGYASIRCMQHQLCTSG